MAIETTPLGFKKPDGNELVNGGDNVIADNAQKAEDRHQEDRGRLSAIEAVNTAQEVRLDGVEAGNATQDGSLAAHAARLANLDNAAGFTGDPLALNDEAVAYAVNTGTESHAALDARLTIQVPPIVAAAIATDPTVAESAATMAQSTVGVIPAWKATTAYVAAQRVIAPNGDVVSAKVNFTSGATYSATNWNASTQDGRIVKLEGTVIPTDGDLNNYTTPGPYTGQYGTILNKPNTGTGNMIVFTAGSTIIQIWWTMDAAPIMWVRRRFSGTWSAWTDSVGVGVAKAQGGRGILPSGADLNVYATTAHNGEWGLSTTLIGTYLNLPPGVTVRGVLEVIAPNEWTVVQRVTPYTGDIYLWRTVQSPTGPAWGEWKTAYLGTPVPPTGDAISALPTTDWAHWGDSLTDDEALAADSWVTKLATLTGKNHLNEGWYGHFAAQIAARQGGNPALVTVDGGTIPASGTPVMVHAATPHVSMPVGVQQPARQVPGTLAGRAGYLYDGGLDVTDGYFMPTSGTSTTATGAYPFIPSGVADTGRSRVMTICVGENDIFSTGQSPQDVAYMARQMHDYQNSQVKRVLVLSIPRREGSGASTGTGQKTQAINDALKAEFPSQFVDVAGYLMSDQAATDAGITYTTDDLTDIADGVTPRSFRMPADSVHWNATACNIVANFVYAAARVRGWV